MMNKQTKWILWIVLIVFLAVLPKFAGIYHTNVFLNFAIFSVFAVSVNMLLGFTRLLSFGHAAYFGLGAYGTALALRHIDGIGLLTAIGSGVLLAIAFGLLVCPIVVRVSGAAFAMVHLAFGQLMYILALRLRNVTGGEDGIGRFPVPPLEIPGIVSIPIFRQPENFYYLAIVILLLTLIFMWHFTKTPFGQVQAGIRDNPGRIDYIGFKVPQTKAIIYVVSAACAGIAGAIYVLFLNSVSPGGVFHILVHFTPIVAAVLGGMGSFFGPILGMGLYLLVEEIALTFTNKVELIMGVMLVGMVMFAPLGVVGIIKSLRQRIFPSSVNTVVEKNS